MVVKVRTFIGMSKKIVPVKSQMGINKLGCVIYRFNQKLVYKKPHGEIVKFKLN